MCLRAKYAFLVGVMFTVEASPSYRRRLRPEDPRPSGRLEHPNGAADQRRRRRVMASDRPRTWQLGGRLRDDPHLVHTRRQRMIIIS